MPEKENRSKQKVTGLTYRDSGVDIDLAKQAKTKIREFARSTFNSAVVSDIGAFAGLYRPPFGEYQKPILVSSADGVGTKLKIAFMTGVHKTVGIDIVSHCTNDILVHGALPIFFLDYIATGQLEPHIVTDIVEGLAEGCRESECVLIGGETAEMPDFYQPGEYDLAGFIVGMADESSLYHPPTVSSGDVVLGLRSSGLHTNGYSLVRKLFFEREKMDVDTYVDEFQKTVGEELLIPHRNYLPLLKELVRSGKLSALAHITGGGITDNLDRVITPNLNAVIRKGSWTNLPIFEFIADRGNVNEEEMLRTFNMGIGMILVVPPGNLEAVRNELGARGENPFVIGELKPGQGKVVYE